MSHPNTIDWAHLAPAQARALFASGASRPTTGVSDGFVQANLVVLPTSALADDFADFCRQNPKACPLLERLDAGDPRVKKLVKTDTTSNDIRTCLPLYRVFSRSSSSSSPSSFEQVTDLTPFFRSSAGSAAAAAAGGSTAFLMGCSFSFEAALAAAGVPIYHAAASRNVPMYKTRIQLNRVGPFGGALVVSYRPVKQSQVQLAYAITARFARTHGEPISRDPAELGIADLSRPEFGDAPVFDYRLENEKDENQSDPFVPLFWCCGVSSSVAVVSALESGALGTADGVVVSCHAPGCMFISDLRNEELMTAE